MKFEKILDKVFEPIFLAIANFCLFGACLAIGIITKNVLVAYASTGFFIGGASIGVLVITDRWILKNEIGETYIVKEGIKHGVPTSQNKVYTQIEM